MEMIADHHFDAPLDQVWAMFTDEGSHIVKFESMGHRNIEVLESVATAEGISIKIQRDVDVELPGFAKRFLKPTNSVVSTDEWRDVGDGTRAGEFKLEAAGSPVDIHGTTRLSPADDGGTDYHIVTELSVNVPLVGGKIANWAKGIASKQLDLEFAAGDRWLDEHG
jgi:hypothetical protein